MSPSDAACVGTASSDVLEGNRTTDSSIIDGVDLQFLLE